MACRDLLIARHFLRVGGEVVRPEADMVFACELARHEHSKWQVDHMVPTN
jgi:hypothetical protein